MNKKTNVILTHPDKILYPENKITKKMLYEYYDNIQELILPYITNRPLTIVRCPENYKSCFYQKHLQHPLLGLHTFPIKEKLKTDEYFFIEDVVGLFELVQIGCLELHPWGSMINHVEHPDMIIFDLDPAPDVSWKKVVAAAFEIKNFLHKMKLKSFVKTTGGKGLHVVVPISPKYSWDEIKNFAHDIVNQMVLENPRDYINTMSKIKRKGKVFLDYLRNGRGATAIAPYSTRARLHAPIATPIHWDELTNNIRDNFFTLKTIPAHLKHRKADPWKNFLKLTQQLI